MKSEILVIGDELLIGQVTDTNSGFIAKKLNSIGIDVSRIVTVRDNAEEITAAVNESLSRVDLLAITGGLGPTNDDITKITLCNIFGGKLTFSPETQEANDRLFAMRGKEMNNLTRGQAMLPDVCTVIPNRLGTAPAMMFKQGGKVVVSMPGVPFEMKDIMDNRLIPLFKEIFPDRGNILHATRLVSGFTESKLAEFLTQYEASLPEDIKMAYLPNLGIIRLRLTIHGENRNTVQVKLNRYAKKLDLLLGEHIVAKSDMKPSEALGNLLKERNMTISTAESCTGGAISAAITSVPGASTYYKGSIISYHNSIKTGLLGVDENDIRIYGVVSDKVVAQMAYGATINTGTDCAIATSGIAGPDGGSKSKPVGTVAISVYCRGSYLTKTINFPPADRDKNIERFTSTAISMMISLLKNIKP